MPVPSPTEALGSLPAEGRVAILCDYRLKNGPGLDWIHDLRRADVGPVIIVTSMSDERIVAEAFRAGAADYLGKCEAIRDPGLLHSTIAEAIRRFTLDHSNRDLNRRLKITNNALRHKTERLAELTNNAHRFVEDVAHEFRTPLAVVQEFASIMSDGIGGEVTPKQAEYFRFIQQAARDLTHLVDDFLDVGKLRAQTLCMDRREHVVVDFLEACRPMLESRAAARGVVVEQHLEDNLPPIYADGDKVRRTIINLVVNAVKFSSLGAVVCVHAEREGDASVKISVSDQGQGMAKEEVQNLFERFSPGAEAASGFGLGLSIVSELVSLNLGALSVESERGTGSTFSFTLPVNEPRHVIEAYLQGVSRRSPNESLQAMMVRRENASTDIKNLQAFLASISHAQDLQIPLLDKKSVLLVGVTSEPHQ